jgi:hypothetical protein
VALYYFHIRCNGELIRDPEGLELPDLETAMHEALKGAWSMMSADILTGTLRLNQAIEICDSRGRSLSTLRFADAVSIIP